VAHAEMQIFVEALCWLWFSTMGQRFARRYDLPDHQKIGGENRAVVDFEAPSRRMLGALRRQRLTTKALSGCLHI